VLAAEETERIGAFFKEWADRSVLPETVLERILAEPRTLESEVRAFGVAGALTAAGIAARGNHRR